MTVFLRLLAEDDKPQALLAAVRVAAGGRQLAEGSGLAAGQGASGKVFEVYSARLSFRFSPSQW